MCEQMSITNFYHTGAMGDIIYSLPTIISFGGGRLYVGKRTHYGFLNTLLEKQDYIEDVINFLGPGIKKLEAIYLKKRFEKRWKQLVSSGFIDLNKYRKFHKTDVHKHLADCHLDCFSMKFDLSQSWIDNIDSKPISKIVINRTRRYHDREDINWNILRDYIDDVIYIGYQWEHNLFVRAYGLKVKFYQVKDALEIVEIIKGSKFFIGNQSLPFALAEAIKHPRALEVYYGMNNCQPRGEDGYTVLTNEILEKYLCF